MGFSETSECLADSAVTSLPIKPSGSWVLKMSAYLQQHIGNGISICLTQKGLKYSQVINQELEEK